MARLAWALWPSAFLLTGAPVDGQPLSASQATPDEPAFRGSLLLPQERAELGSVAIRGVTIGPIESTLHPGRGYGSPAFERCLDEAVRLGATWISLTPFGRAWDLKATGIDQSFELPLLENQRGMRKAIKQAHARGLRVQLVPHLWVESGGWRTFA